MARTESDFRAHDERTANRDTEPPPLAVAKPREIGSARRWSLVHVFDHAPLERAAARLLAPGGRTFGRSGDIRVADTAVSRTHARLVHRDGQLEITDLSSRNGLFVNGERVTAKTLAAGDVLRMGSNIWIVGDGEPRLPHHARGRAIAKGNLPLIIHGETGTGKEVLARLIHDESGRKGRFVAVDCSSLPTTLAESELFGHRRGAFSGAATSREGLFRHAHEGTILLDEIADLGAELQSKLLRVLESHRVRPLGAEDEVSVDVRVIAASPIDLDSLVSAGRFRRDLFGRLAGRIIQIPPLRRRPDELLPLLAELGREQNTELVFTVEAAEDLLLYPWPQNVRELKMFVRRVVEDVPAEVGTGELPKRCLTREAVAHLQIVRISPDGGRMARFPSIVKRRQRRVTREALAKALSESGGNVTEAARILGRRRELVHRWKRAYGIM